MKRTSDTTKAKRNEEGIQYLLTIQKTDRPWCWACGRDESQRPEAWHARWVLNLAHIAAGGSKMKRHLNRRAIVILCGWCHLLHCTHGANLQQVMGVTCPKLSNANVLWIKRTFDLIFWDPAWIAERWIGVVPEPIQPAAWFLDQYRQRRPENIIF